MKAKFIGKDYLGFKYGKYYEIKTECNIVNINGNKKSCLCVYDKNSSSWCPYSNLETMLKNWEI